MTDSRYVRTVWWVWFLAVVAALVFANVQVASAHSLRTDRTVAKAKSAARNECGRHLLVICKWVYRPQFWDTHNAAHTTWYNVKIKEFPGGDRWLCVAVWHGQGTLSSDLEYRRKC
jgi:hypothetical protein